MTPDDVELDDLVRRAQAGDAAALEAVLAGVQPLVQRRCARFFPHHADAQDAAQEALLTISRKLGSYAGRGSFLGWVTIVTSNSARSTYRSMVRRAEVPSSVDSAPERPDPRTTSVIAGTRLDLLDAIEELERHHPVAVEAFVLRDLGELSYDEIVLVTGDRLSLVKDRIHQARTFVRARLRPDARR